VLTLILLGLLGGSGWYASKQRRRAHKAEAQLRRIACTDDEVMAVLEASSGPLAERLLLATRSETSRGAPDEKQWRTIMRDLRSVTLDSARERLLYDYLDDGLLVSEKQYVQLVKLFDLDAIKHKVREALRKRRVERVKRA
jgi:hypothetical protein